MGIRFILMVNKQGQTRLAQYYEYLTLEERRALEGEIVRKCLARTEQQACGKGRSLSLWNLPVYECISRIRTKSSIQDVIFDDNQILAVGAAPLLSRFDMKGDILSQINCAPQSVFSISLHPSGVTAVSGYGGLVDIISQFGSHLCTFRGKSL